MDGGRRGKDDRKQNTLAPLIKGDVDQVYTASVTIFEHIAIAEDLSTYKNIINKGESSKQGSALILRLIFFLFAKPNQVSFLCLSGTSLYFLPLLFNSQKHLSEF
jgi:hypothetical protein